MKLGKKKANWSNPDTTAENEILPKWFSLAWTSRGTAVSINAVFIGYITYYATDMLGLSAGLIGMLILVSKVFDGFTDLVAGFLIDKTHTKLGKARPYEVFIVFAWICTIIMFSVPDWGTTAKAAIVFIMYTLLNAVCITFLGAEDAVYMRRSIRSPKNRVTVMSVSGSIGMIAVVGFSIIFPQLMASIGTTKAGWSKLAVMIGVPMALIGILRMVFIKEVVEEDEENQERKEKIEFKTMISAIAKNKYIFIIAALNFITFVISGLNTTATTYYFRYIVGDIGLMSVASMAAMTTPLFLIVFPMLNRKFGSTKIMRAAAVFGIVGIVIRTLGGTNMNTILLGGIIASVASIPLTVMINAYLIDCMDYGEWKTGIRVEGGLNSVSNFMGKIGMAASSGLVGLIMGVAGYDGTASVQTAAANHAIIAVYNYLPLILYVLMFVLSLFYKVEKYMPEIKKALEHKSV